MFYLVRNLVLLNGAHKDFRKIGARVITLNWSVRELLCLEAPVIGTFGRRVDIMPSDPKERITGLGGPGIEGERNLTRNVLRCA